jgi:MFS transporter, FHS family, glucose/mannose:H+ symporter
MKNMQLKVALLFNFALPALLLNCVGIFVLNLTNNYGITAGMAGWLEPFKDFSILICSFLLVSYIPRMGYKKTLLIGLVLQMIGCIEMALFPSFLASSIFFIFIGVGFGLIKVSAYSSVGLITSNESEHAGFLSMLEGFFMVGILIGFWIFAFFMKYMGGWTNTFWFLLALCVVGFFLLLLAPFDESKLKKEEQEEAAMHKESFVTGYIKMAKVFLEIAAWFFIVLAFCYLFIEQGVLNFLPLFDQNILHLSSSASVQIASLLTGGIALGRLVFGYVMKYIHWSKVLFVCILLSLVVLFLALYLAANLPLHSGDAISAWTKFPLAAYMLPVVGFLVGPIYPTLCSSILSKQKISDQSAMSVIIVIFSAIGGTVGSVWVGNLFDAVGGLRAFSIFMVPLFCLMILVLPYHFLLKRMPMDPMVKEEENK